MNTAATIEEFIATFPADVQLILQNVRRTIQQATPQATEKISYGIPTFYYKGNLVHFSGYAKHIGFYPGPTAIAHFKKELAAYPTSKGAIKFALDKPIPYELIAQITAYCVQLNNAK